VRVIKEMVSRIDATGTLAVLPDALAGHRLAGTSKNLASLQQALREIGVTPILIDAFRDRGARTEGQQRVAG